MRPENACVTATPRPAGSRAIANPAAVLMAAAILRDLFALFLIIPRGSDALIRVRCGALMPAQVEG